MEPDAIAAAASLAGEDEPTAPDRPQPRQALRVVNLVHRAALSPAFRTRLPLHRLASGLYGRWDENIFPALKLTVREPYTAAQIFDTGNAVFPGPTSHIDALYAAYLVAHGIMQAAGIACDVHHFRLANVVAAWAEGAFLDIPRFHRDHKLILNLESKGAGGDEEGCKWEPELFPGAEYTRKCPETGNKVMFLLYRSGAIVAQSIDVETICIEYRKLHRKLRLYHSETTASSLPADQQHLRLHCLGRRPAAASGARAAHSAARTKRKASTRGGGGTGGDGRPVKASKPNPPVVLVPMSPLLLT